MPIQAPQRTDYLNCPACCREFSRRRSPVSLSCGHTLCKPCLKSLIRKQCPFDQTVISVSAEELPVNSALLLLSGYNPPPQPIQPPQIQTLPESDRLAYDVIVKYLEQLAYYLNYVGIASAYQTNSRLSRPMQRKLVTLLQCAFMDEDGRGKMARAARSLAERTVTEFILQHQNPQQLSANLWAAVRSRGCQFLGPAMQEEVLKLVLLALEDGSALCRKVLVMFIVQRLEPHFTQASKTSIGHVVQLLYRASCFKVSKRESDSSLMQLKEEFRTYETLRREHDAQIVQIATESGLRIAPDQWGALLYGDTLHKSHMQSIIDKLQTLQTFAQSVEEFLFLLQRTGDPAQLMHLSIPLEHLANIDDSPVAKSPSWQELSEIMTSLNTVVYNHVSFSTNHGARGQNANGRTVCPTNSPNNNTPNCIASHLPGRYKVEMCRDAQTFCPRSHSCTYAHSEEELESQRVKNPGVATMPRGQMSGRPRGRRSDNRRSPAQNGSYWAPPPRYLYVAHTYPSPNPRYRGPPNGLPMPDIGLPPMPDIGLPPMPPWMPPPIMGPYIMHPFPRFAVPPPPFPMYPPQVQSPMDQNQYPIPDRAPVANSPFDHLDQHWSEHSRFEEHHSEYSRPNKNYMGTYANAVINGRENRPHHQNVGRAHEFGSMNGMGSRNSNGPCPQMNDSGICMANGMERAAQSERGMGSRNNGMNGESNDMPPPGSRLSHYLSERASIPFSPQIDNSGVTSPTPFPAVGPLRYEGRNFTAYQPAKNDRDLYNSTVRRPNKQFDERSVRKLSDTRIGPQADNYRQMAQQSKDKIDNDELEIEMKALEERISNVISESDADKQDKPCLD